MNKSNYRTGNFDSLASLYHRARPGYPEPLFDDLVQYCGLLPGSRVLEIGPGTGQATVPLTQRGFDVVAVEAGANLARVASENLAHFANATVVNAAFEDVALPSGSFDCVLAATAFHWLDPASRFSRCHAFLREKGHLAIIHTEPVSSSQGDAFIAASQPIYRRFSETSDVHPYKPSRIEELTPPGIDTERFALKLFKAYPVDTTYTTASYLDLLRTFSPTIAMTPDNRERFLDAIGTLINTDFSGNIVRHVAMTLAVCGRID